jgi:hypothetical protein
MELFVLCSPSVRGGGVEGRNALNLIYRVLLKNAQTDKFYIKNDMAHDPHILKVAKQYPKLQFLHCGGFYIPGKHPNNVGTLARALWK